MFAKMLLSVVSLLFIGSQITSVSAECGTPPTWDGENCSTASCGTDDYGYYYDSGTVIEVTGASTCNKVTKPGYYKTNDGSYYSVKHDGTHSTAISPGASCTAVLNLFTNGKLCVVAEDTTNVIDIGGEGDGNLYVVPNGSFFSASGTNVLVKSEKNALTYVALAGSTSYLAKDVGGILTTNAGDFIAIKDNSGDAIKDTAITSKEYCVDNNSKIITERPKNYCNAGVNCGKYYTCTEGVCIDTTDEIAARSGLEPCNPITGANCQLADYGDYYFIGTEESKDESSLSGVLKDSAGAGYLYKCTVSADPVSCSQDTTTIGYLHNADSSHNGDAGIPYIECSATTTTTTIKVSGQSVTVAKNSCTAITKPVAGTCDGNTGKLIYATSYKLCIDETSNPVVAGTAANYLVDAHSVSTFEATGVQSGFSVVVEVDEAGNFIRRAQTGKKYIYALKTGKRVYDKGETGYAAAMCSGEPSSLKTGDADEYILNKTEGDLVDYYKVNSQE